eukprot:GDKI01026918.1.p1 GENE.GDKI01026918.1~~GDKI01026918.1.p1  ORF type:complete len:109 (+),score=16.48 GDKI01026918.1:145-471(+)
MGDVFLAEGLDLEATVRNVKIKSHARAAAIIRQFVTRDVYDALMEMPEEESRDVDKVWEFLDERYDNKPTDKLNYWLKQLVGLMQQNGEGLAAYMTRAETIFREIRAR